MQDPQPTRKRSLPLWVGLLAGMLALTTLAVARLRREPTAETPPSPPNQLQVVSVQPVVGDPQAFRVVARMSRDDGGPILGAFQISADLHHPATGKQLLRRQCSYTLQDTADGRATEITLTDRLPVLPAGPVQAQVWIENRWIPRDERLQLDLWQFTQSLLPHPQPQSQPAEPLTCTLTLPPGLPAAAPAHVRSRPPARPKTMRTLLWRAPAGRRLALRN